MAISDIFFHYVLILKMAAFDMLYLLCFNMFLQVDYNEMMMYKPNKRQIRRSFQDGIWLQYKTSPHQIQLHAKIQRLQVSDWFDFIWFLMFNATFSNVSTISWQPVLEVEEAGVPDFNIHLFNSSWSTCCGLVMLHSVLPFRFSLISEGLLSVWFTWNMQTVADDFSDCVIKFLTW